MQIILPPADERALLTMDRIRVLIIDDNPSVRHALTILLSNMPQLNVLGATGCVSEAQDLITRLSPDVVLIEPKHLNGEAISLIQSLVEQGQPQVIVLTGYHDEDEALTMAELGISCYMLKEINSQALLNAIVSSYKPGARSDA